MPIRIGVLVLNSRTDRARKMTWTSTTWACLWQLLANLVGTVRQAIRNAVKLAIVNRKKIFIYKVVVPFRSVFGVVNASVNTGLTTSLLTSSYPISALRCSTAPLDRSFTIGVTTMLYVPGRNIMRSVTVVVILRMLARQKSKIRLGIAVNLLALNDLIVQLQCRCLAS